LEILREGARVFAENSRATRKYAALKLNLNFNAMVNMIIKEHKKDRMYGNPHFFVLNKGTNSGKPQKTSFANSFVLIFDSEVDCENHFNIAYSLWIKKFWIQYLVGNAPRFLRLTYFKLEFPKQAQGMMQEFEEHVRKVAEIKLNKIREENYLKNQALINETKKNLMYRGFRARNANK
jgi:hypothetical protein